MMNIIICKIKYPNDPTNNLKPHQHFIGELDSDKLVLYSISSVLCKEFKVFPKDCSVNPDYFLITGDNQRDCNLKVPSFIDCTKAYKVNLTEEIDINKLSNRKIPEKIRASIVEKIEEIKRKGKHTEYSISTKEFIMNNPRSKK